MDTQQLIDRLEERAAEIPVGPPPVALMRTRARRQRQGRVAVLASAAAVAAVAVGLAWPGGGGSDDGSRPPIASEAPPAPDSPPPAGFRYVGAGDVVAAVPEDWRTNATECGTPTADTVVIDSGPSCLMLVPRPADVDSLTIDPVLVDFDSNGYADVEVGGEKALRSPVRRQDDGTFWQSVILPDADVSFVAESSSADGAEIVDGILDSLTVLRDHITLPGFQDLAFQRSGHRVVDDYVDLLTRLGLEVEVARHGVRGLDAGTMLGTDPAVGSVVAPGEVVRVFVAR